MVKGSLFDIRFSGFDLGGFVVGVIRVSFDCSVRGARLFIC